MKPSIIEVSNRVKRLPLNHCIAYLRNAIASEPPRSIRRVELERLLEQKMRQRLRFEIRRDRKAS